MRIYYELFEILPEGSAEEPDFIRVDVTDYSDEEREVVMDSILSYARDNCEHYVVQIHHCYHDEGGSCIITPVEKR